MSRNKQKPQAARDRREASPAAEAPPTGYIDRADPETGQPERMAYWLPEGVTPESIGLKHGRAM